MSTNRGDVRWLFRRLVLVGIVALVLAVLGACSAAPSAISTPSTPSATIPALPAGGVFLTDLGFTQAPVTFSVPASVRPVNGYNIPDLINVIYNGADGPVVHDYLVANLKSMGFTITAQSADSIVWQNDAWQGAFTMTADQAGFTLRHGR